MRRRCSWRSSGKRHSGRRRGRSSLAGRGADCNRCQRSPGSRRSSRSRSNLAWGRAWLKRQACPPRPAVRFSCFLLRLTLQVALVWALRDGGAVVARPARVADAHAIVAVALAVAAARAGKFGSGGSWPQSEGQQGDARGTHSLPRTLYGHKGKYYLESWSRGGEDARGPARPVPHP